jgi:hypothetical protein
MRIRHPGALGALAALLLLAPAPGAQATPPAPFGHPCAPGDGALLCATTT